MRAVIGVIVGYVVWTALWLAGGLAIAIPYREEQEAFAAGGSYDEAVPLVLSLALSIVCSLSAGCTTTAIARERRRGATIATGILLLLTGIGVQSSVWSQMPVWYHLGFLVLLLPATIAGGRLSKS